MYFSRLIISMLQYIKNACSVPKLFSTERKKETKCWCGQRLLLDTHTASLQQQLAFAETIGAVGELHQGFLGLMSDGGVSGLVQLLTQDLQLGKALDGRRGRHLVTGACRRCIARQEDSTSLHQLPGHLGKSGHGEIRLSSPFH